MKIDVDDLFEGDVYDLLQQRGRRNKARLLQRNGRDQALTERRECACNTNWEEKLKHLGDKFGVSLDDMIELPAEGDDDASTPATEA